MRRKKRKRKKIGKRKSFRKAEVNTKNIKIGLPLPHPPPPPLPPRPPPPLVRLQKAVVRVTTKKRKHKRRKERKISVQRITTMILKRRTSLRRENFMKNFLAVTMTRMKPRKSLGF